MFMRFARALSEPQARDFVRSLYAELLRRPADPGGLEHWVAQSRSLSPTEIYFAFVQSAEYQALQAAPKLYVPPGHFYSPIVDPAEIALRAAQIFAPERPLPGIDLREAEQLRLLEDMAPIAAGLPFASAAQPGVRYHYDNPAFGAGDAVTLACLLALRRPSRLIEVGSGYSSAVTLDMNQRALAWSMRCTFIEPYPALLHSLLAPGDAERISVLPLLVQDVDLAVFDALGPGDVLFIDSTHIVRTGSDVVHHLTRVLPRLRPGVLVHFHDVFYPFEYPSAWVMEDNRSWNELYVLQAFLTNNREYEILLFNDFIGKRHRDVLGRLMPRCLENSGGSLWLRKLPASPITG